MINLKCIVPNCENRIYQGGFVGDLCQSCFNKISTGEFKSIDEIEKIINNYKKCIIHGCKNNKNEGGFIGDICTPCYSMITTGKPSPSNNFIYTMYKDLESIKTIINSYNFDE